MVTVGDSAHGGVQCWSAVARGDDDGCAVAAAYGVEQLLYKDGEHPTCRTGRRVVDGQALGGGAGGQFLNGEMLHTFNLLFYDLQFTIYLQLSNFVIYRSATLSSRAS